MWEIILTLANDKLC